VRGRDVLGGGLFLALGLFTTRYALGQPLGSLRSPGTGFLPLGIGLVLTLFSAILVGRSLLAPAQGTAPPIDRTGILRVLLVVLGTVVYAAALDWIGFVPGTALLMALMFAVGQGRVTWRGVAGGILVSAVSWILFKSLLGVSLPTGRWWAGQWWGG
jgi:hypothetical protein